MKKKCLIAVCGLYRTFNKTYNNIFNKIVQVNPDYDFDVMLNTEKACRDRYKRWLPQKYYDISSWKYDDNDKLETDLKNAYSTLGNIKDIDFFEPDIKHPVFDERIKKVLSKTNDDDYDKIIIIRFDVILTNELKLDDFANDTFYMFASSLRPTRTGFMGCDFDYMYLGNKKTLELFHERHEYPKEKINAKLPELLALTNSTMGEGIRGHSSYVLHILENGYNINVKQSIEKAYLPKMVR